MSLRNVEENLYSRDDGEKESRQGSPQKYESANKKVEPFGIALSKTEKVDKSAIWIKEDEEKKAKRKKMLKIAAISAAVLIFVAGAVWGAIYWRKGAFSEDKVSISLSGPDEVESGDVDTIVVNYKNENRASLKDAVLHIVYGSNFQPAENFNLEPEGTGASRFNIGTIEGKSEGKFELRGKFFGSKGTSAIVSVKLEYSSANFSSKFAIEERKSVLISSSPVSLEVTGPQEVASGGTVSFSVKYQNTGQQVFRNLKLKVDYPRDFLATSSDPMPTQNGNVWYIGDLEEGQSGEVKISGTLNGLPRETKQFNFDLGEFGSDDQFVSYVEISKSVNVVGAAVEITQTVNDKKDSLIVNAGEVLHFKIKFRNVSDVALKDLILTEEILSPILDYGSYDSSGSVRGGLDSTKGMLTWKASEMEKLRVLNPGEEGEAEFSIKVKDIIPISGTKDKNFSFNAACRIDSLDIPTPEGANKTISGNPVAVKLSSKIIITQEGYYNDSAITNSGPIPLKVGEPTTFTFHFKVENISNDVTNAKVVAALSPGVEWKNNFLPKDASVEFNSRTNELTWNIGTIPAGVGLITDPKELTFQIAVTPSANLVGGYAPLLGQTVFTADDAFTGQKLESKLGRKDSNLTEDLSVGNEGKVVQ